MTGCLQWPGAGFEDEDPGLDKAVTGMESRELAPITQHHPWSVLCRALSRGTPVSPPAACSGKGMCYIQWTAACCELAKYPQRGNIIL